MNNPQAFPGKTVENRHNGRDDIKMDVYHKGMTLLDYYAVKAMQVLMSNPKYEVNGGYIHAESVAKESYDMATAMLIEREKRMK